MIQDISHWQIDERINASGIREKFWLIEPSTSIRYLFKLPREKTGEVWAEEINATIGRLLGLSMMETSIVSYHGRIGILLKNFIAHKGEEFYSGADLLKTIIDSFNPAELTDYTLKNIIACLKPFKLDEQIASMILFDALIANQDRHCENWGIIRKGDNFVFSPLFDNGSSLGCNLSEDKVNQLLSDKNRFQAFTARGRQMIGCGSTKRPKIERVLNELLAQYPQKVLQAIDSITHLSDQAITNVVDRIPEEAMTLWQKKWCIQLIVYRRKYLIDWYMGRLKNA